MTRGASEQIYSHLTHDPTDPLSAMLPDVATVETLVETAFWASLRREEGRTPLISIAFVSPQNAGQPIFFERSLPLTAEPLAKIAGAAERPGIHIGVWPENGELRAWGATQTLPAHCFVLEAIAPGHLVIKQSRREDSGKFLNVAVLEGDRVKVIDPRTATVPDCPALLTSMLDLESRFGAGSEVNVLIQLAVSMREHLRGGTLLVTPPETGEWRESILQPILYAVRPTFSALADLMRAPSRKSRQWKDELSRIVKGLAGVTAVDGATVINARYELLAFGAKIVRRSACEPIVQVLLTEPVVGASPTVVEPSELGGTRHFSAAQFVNDQRDSIAMVASQDGRFTVFAWSPCENLVHAHRIDVLLL